MGRPERNTDITDNAGMKGKLHNGESFFPTTHSKQIISDGEGGRAVEIVTKFHCDDAHRWKSISASPPLKSLVTDLISARLTHRPGEVGRTWFRSRSSAFMATQ